MVHIEGGNTSVEYPLDLSSSICSETPGVLNSVPYAGLANLLC